ncbi:MAG: type II toxin-antitoxin system RelE/ParE family toxin [Gracilimonas sp.]|jgi:addiction module RelE/StbE family toxin|nr:type II toxin-antitoxin system RelE/ParE family toxin [Gracilimonas sp.]
MAKLNWTNQANNDLISIAEYIALDSIKYAKIQVKRIRDKTLQLKEFPTSGRKVPEYDSPAIRELILGNYRIIHHIVDENRIDILTVHHSRRSLNLNLPEEINS